MVNKSIVEMITDWSLTAGVPVKTSFSIPTIDRLDISTKLIVEEYVELLNSVAVRYQLGAKHPEEVDYAELSDALGDLIWVSIRMLMEIGVDPNQLIEEIYKSNMSKFDETEEDAVITHNKYMNEGVATYTKEVNGRYVTYRSSDNKVLKSHKFVTPDFSRLGIPVKEEKL